MTEGRNNNQILKKGGALLFWLLIWQLGASAANRSLLLPIPTPVDTAAALLRFLGQADFYLTVASSLGRICAGFVLAFITGTLCAFLAARYEWFHILTSPLLQLIRAIPVASFTILVFLWVSRGKIPGTISFLTVFPIIWANVENGLRNADRRLSEMAAVFGMGKADILRQVTLPSLRPYFSTAAATGLGFAWKSGVAAEVICRTGNSLGDMLWASKSAVCYDEVFALTAVIVLCSTALEALARRLLKEARRD